MTTLLERMLPFTAAMNNETDEERTMINIENARRLIKRLGSKDNPVDFHMSYWFDHNGTGYDDPTEICEIVSAHACGTAACLAGHAALEAWESGDVDTKVYGSVQEVAQMWLGLSYWRAKSLFHGHWNNETLTDDLSSLTVEKAITELNRLIELKELGTAT